MLIAQYMDFSGVYNIESLDGLWYRNLYFCFINEFIFSFIFYVVLIILFCVFLDTTYYVSRTLSYWKNNDIRSKLTDDDCLVLMEQAIKTEGIHTSNVMKVINNKETFDTLLCIKSSEALRSEVKSINSTLGSLVYDDISNRDNNKSKNLADFFNIDSNNKNAMSIKEEKLDFKDFNEFKKYIKDLLSIIKGEQVNDDAIIENLKLLKIGDSFIEYVSMDFNEINTEYLLKNAHNSSLTEVEKKDLKKQLEEELNKINQDSRKYHKTKCDDIKVIDKVIDNLRSAYILDIFSKLSKDGVFSKYHIGVDRYKNYKNIFGHIKKISRSFINNIEFFAFASIIKKFIDSNDMEKYFFRKYFECNVGDLLVLYSAFHEYVLTGIYDKSEEYDAKISKLLKNEKAYDDFVNQMKVDEKYSVIYLLNKGEDSRDLFLDFLKIEYDNLAKDNYDCFTLNFKNSNYSNYSNSFMRKCAHENRIYGSLTGKDINSSYIDKYNVFSNDLLGRLNDIYYNALSSINPLKKFILRILIFDRTLFGIGEENDINHIKDKYVFLRLIRQDEGYLVLSILCIFSCLGWWLLAEVGFRALHAVQDFDKIALGISPIFNANIEYVNSNLFLDFSKNISDFHHIVFISTLFAAWLIFSLYSYIQYFDILFGVGVNFILHLMSFILFIALMFFQKDVINVSTQEMMIDYSSRAHMVVSSPENVIKYYEDNVSRSKYNKWAMLVFFVFTIFYLLYSVFRVNLVRAIRLFAINLSFSKDEDKVPSYGSLSLADIASGDSPINGILFDENKVTEQLKESIKKKFVGEAELHIEIISHVGKLKNKVLAADIAVKMLTFIFMFYMSIVFCSLSGSFKFFIIDYANLWFIFKSPEDIAMMTEVNNIDEMTLKIDRYILFDLDETKFDISKKKFIFMFKNAMFAGDFDEMNNLLDSCEHEDLKTLIKSKLNDNKNLLLHNIDIKFKGNELEIIEDEWRYKLSANMVELHGASGTGKSTIQNFLIGKRKYIGAKVNDILTYYMNPTSRHLLPSFSSSYTNYFGTVSLFDNLQNADENFNKDSSVFRDLGISKYSEQLSSNYSDIFMSMGQRCRMDFVYFFTQLDSNIESGRTGFMSFMDEPFGALDDASVQFTWDIMSRYIEKYNLLFFIVDHSGFAASKADLRMVIKDKTLKFFVDDKLQLKDLEFDEDGIAEYNGKKIYRELIGNMTVNDSVKLNDVNISKISDQSNDGKYDIVESQNLNNENNE